MSLPIDITSCFLSESTAASTIATPPVLTSNSFPSNSETFLPHYLPSKDAHSLCIPSNPIHFALKSRKFDKEKELSLNSRSLPDITLIDVCGVSKAKNRPSISSQTSYELRKDPNICVSESNDKISVDSNHISNQVDGSGEWKGVERESRKTEEGETEGDRSYPYAVDVEADMHSKVSTKQAIYSLEVIHHELVKVLHNRGDSMRLDKCKMILERYKGTDWVAYSRLPEMKNGMVRGYTRAEVSRQEDFFSLLVLTWSPTAASAVHNHPCERCFLMPLQGDMWEVRYTVDEELKSYREQSCTQLHLNVACWIDDSHGWHSIENPGTGIAVSLHLYVPAFTKCKIIEPLSKSIIWANCFPSSTGQGMQPLHLRILDLAPKVLQPPDFDINKMRCSKMDDRLKKIFDELAFTLASPPCDDESILAAINAAVDVSNSGQLYFFNQLFCRADSIAVAADCLTACLNIDMQDPQMAHVFQRMEKHLLMHLASFLGWYNSRPFRCLNNCNTMPAEGKLKSIQEISQSYVVGRKHNEIGCRNAGPAGAVDIDKISNDLIRVDSNLEDFDTFDGIFSPGGTLSNVMALNIARHYKYPRLKQTGLYSHLRPLIIYTSEQGHESIDKAASLLGFGYDSVVIIPTDEWNCLDTMALRKSLDKTLKSEGEPFFVNCTAGTTIAGAFDRFQEIRQVCDEFNMWMHVDGALGAAFLLPPEDPFKTLCKGMNSADSVTWNLHKLLGVPLQCSALLTRHAGLLSRTHTTARPCTYPNPGSRPYLDPARSRVKVEEEAMDGSRMQTADSTFMCGRRADAFKVWCLWKKMGDIGMSNRIRLIYSYTQQAARMLLSYPTCFSAVSNRLEDLTQRSTATGEPVCPKSIAGDDAAKSHSNGTVKSGSDSGVFSGSNGAGDRDSYNGNSCRLISLDTQNDPTYNGNSHGVPIGLDIPTDLNNLAFALVWEPTSCNCCFWWIPYDLRSLFYRSGSAAVGHELDSVAEKMKAHMLLETGSVMIDYHTVPHMHPHNHQPVCGRFCSGDSQEEDDVVERGRGGKVVVKGSWKHLRLPFFWRIAFVNHNITGTDIFNILEIVNNIGNTCFPPGSFLQ